ncbi:DoxX family protein [Pigmentibacter sp. JX0631]|uniref:DoxX family protein n=1 Tax=Pigmentibacter sp. JX0631 TaxID=2976982 RepID=UPI0024685AA6|nr:DoxX family protein [Pigmentibacter sp. JX0631]WGL61326.1 DoxX family protein [Pigmentibacter sp. JX0631]
MLQKLFSVSTYGAKMDFMLLLIRLFFGYAFIMHGYGKILSPFSWMGEDSSVPGVLQALAAISEFGGGIAIILGLFSRLSSIGIACTMAVAIYSSKFIFGLELIGKKGGPSYELAAIYFLLSLLFLVAGPGKLSLDKLFFSKK